MIKTKEDKSNDLIYRTYYCRICEKELLRTIENRFGFYVTPVTIVHCKDCGAKHTIKMVDNKIEFTLLSYKKQSKAVY